MRAEAARVKFEEEHLRSDMASADFFSGLIRYVKTYKKKTKQEKAQQLILSNAENLSPAFVRQLLPRLLPDLNDTAIFEATIECFVCYSELDFSTDQILFLTCCDGGSFACSSCVVCSS